MKKKNQWATQRALKKEDIPSRDKIISIAKAIPKPQEQAFFIIAYLTAGRISEILPQKYLKKVTYLKKIHEDETGNRINKVVRNDNGSPMMASVTKERIDYSGIRRDNIEFMFQQNRRIMIVSMQNRKNRRIKRKRIPIPYDKEPELLELLEDYIKKLPKNDSPLFKMSISKGEKIIMKYAKMNPHYLRDIRLTHLVVYHNFNEYRLMKYAGWKDGRPADRYIRLGVVDILGGEY